MSSRKSNLRLMGAMAALGALALAVSCQGFFPPKSLTAITVDPPTPSVDTGSTIQMSATGTYDDNSTGTLTSGTTCTGNSVCWTESSGGSVTTISSGGLITGVATGTSTVTATSGSISGDTTVTVVLGNVTGLTLDQTTYTISAPNNTVNAFASATTPSGKVDVSATATWTTGNANIATVEGDETPAIITGVATGNTTVTATYTSNGVTYTATANVDVE